MTRSPFLLLLTMSACAGNVDGGGATPRPITLQSASVQSFTLKTSVSGQFVTAENGGGGVINANRAVASTWETFTLHDANGGALENGDLVNIQTDTGQFWCAENGGGGQLDATRSVASTWETFRVLKISGGDATVRAGDAIALQTYVTGNYVSALNGGGAGVVADRTAVQAWEVFIFGGQATTGWTLTWSDEFDGGYGAIDASKWSFDVGNNGWGNAELEYYRDGTNNAFVDGNGHLAIVARQESFGGSAYTSARINTGGKFAQAYGRFEARIRMPSGRGIWPAFWILGDNIGSVGWPQCGELDIMEAVDDFSVNHGSVHGPGYSGGADLTATYQNPNGVSLADDFHVYALEWAPGVVRFYVDDVLYETRTPADVPGKQWVYDHPFFIIMNVAVGGNWPGAPDSTTVFPQTMLVDYVRVYSQS
jgi:beta-glucanase (GH16 family)